jgi:hypothetical protein
LLFITPPYFRLYNHNPNNPADQYFITLITPKFKIGHAHQIAIYADLKSRVYEINALIDAE